MYRFACTWVAANSRGVLLDGEGTEPTEFDTVTPRQSRCNRLKYRLHNALNLVMDEVRVLLSQSLNEL